MIYISSVAEEITQHCTSYSLVELLKFTKTLKKVIRWFRKHLIAHNLGQSQSIVQIKF